MPSHGVCYRLKIGAPGLDGYTGFMPEKGQLMTLLRLLWLLVLAVSCRQAPPTQTPERPAATTPAGNQAAPPLQTPPENPTPTIAATPGGAQAPPPTLDNMIPQPVSVTATGGAFALTAPATIFVEPETEELAAIGQYLADRLRPATGFALPVVAAAGPPAPGNIYLTTVGGDPALGEEGYELTITPEAITLVAYRPAGLFRGIQTIRQLLSPAIESATAQTGPWLVATGTIRDYPRFAWRGMMLDVARHFFGVAEVKRLIDLIAYYKINRFHIHLADDQGWRIMINSWPELATYGGSTAVGGGPGGYYTQEEYAEIVAYAQSRYIVVVPEIDMPGHTNAALAAYAELNCDGVAPPLHTGIETGFSSLCTDKEITFTFVDDVIREIAALTPGPYLHIGGDEALATNPGDYVQFVERAQAIVQSYGKQMVGWEEIAQVNLLPSSVAQHWNSTLAQAAAAQGVQVIMSPASRAYLDMKYNSSTSLGFSWAGYVEVEDAYNWDPATQVSGLAENDILGLEAPLWSETLQTIDDIEFMAFPRLPGHAEIGWSPAGARSWDEYRLRLAAHGPRLAAMAVDFYQSPSVPWQP
ncbi:MAG: family 20 glycosylhydrolase [Chloroflexi bacterium]|nr:family 20 glycosylhydrolase [Chloroflexota bacterium]MCI0579804.1 family 20 glycosylhydrolase [Chloroflexota bacterium]MCI0731077.1 family 20 glycosylhydrolase [Chloroflexota bacterium]